MNFSEMSDKINPKKIDYFLDQKVEDQTRFSISKGVVIEEKQIPSSYFFITKTIAFYSRNFLAIFLFAGIVFVILSSVLGSQEVFGYNKIFSAAAIFLLLIFYFSALAIFTIEEETGILNANILSLFGFLPALYSSLIFAIVIFGGAILSFVPEFLIINFSKQSLVLNVVGISIFVLSFLVILCWYSLFLLVALDEKKYGFKALVRSKKYVQANFLNYLWRILFFLAMIPIIFLLTKYLTNGVVVVWDLVHYMIDIEKVRLVIFLQHFFLSFGNNTDDYFKAAGTFFIAIFLAIPFGAIYLSFLYSHLSAKEPLPADFSGSLFDKIILKLFAIIGILALIFLSKQLL